MIACIPDIVRIHAEGAAFMWTQRAAFMHDPAMGEVELGRLDRRLWAHLAGLASAGPTALEQLHQRFDAFPEAGEAFALLVTALARGDPSDALKAACERPECWPGLSGAVAWSGIPALKPHIPAWFRSGEPLCRCLTVAAYGHYRLDPGARLPDFLADPDPRVRNRALRLIGEIGRGDLGPALDGALASDAPEDRFWAARSALLLGRKADAMPVLRPLAEIEGPNANAALELAAIGGRWEDLKSWWGELIRNPDRRDAAIALAGELAPARAWLIEAAGTPDFSAAAGRALRAIYDFDFDDTDAFERDGRKLGSGFAVRGDGPWPVPDRVRAAIAVHGGRGTFRSLPGQRRACLRAALSDPGHPLPDWRHRRDRPAWF